MHTALAGHGTVDVLLGVRELLAELASPRDECIVLDPALVTLADAESIAAWLTKYPRPVVVFSSVTTAALESGVLLAQRTSARFIFRGTPNERSALECALLLTPDAPLGVALLAILEDNMNRLPSGIRNRMASMFQNGDCPSSPKALAAASAMARRSLDRCLAEAGFVSTRKVIEAARVTSAYRAITTSRTPLGHIASMLGYKSQRTLDAQMTLLMSTTSGKLRTDPLSCAEAADFLAARLIARETPPERKSPYPRRAHGSAPGSGMTSLKLVDSKSHIRHRRRTASGDR